MAPTLAALAKLVGTRNIDAELEELEEHERKSGNCTSIFASRLAVLALCSLIHTRRVYSLDDILSAVEAAPNPKLAYCALVYYRRFVKQQNGAQAWIAFRLLMMLDATHLEKSPVNKFPDLLELSADEAEALEAKFPLIKWKRAATLEGDALLEALKQDPSAVHRASPQALEILKASKPKTAALKCIVSALRHSDSDMLKQLPRTNYRLGATCFAIYFANDNYKQSPFSHEFSPQWLAFLRTLVPALFKAKAWTHYEGVPFGVPIFLSFCLAVRPTELPPLQLRGANKAWLELCRLLLSGTGDLAALESSYRLLPTKSQLLALDVLIRSGGDVAALGQKFVELYRPGLVDAEPLRLLFLMEGEVELYRALEDEQAGQAMQADKVADQARGAPSGAAEQIPSWVPSSAEFVQALYAAPVSAMLRTIELYARPVGACIKLLEQSLPTLNTLSISSANQMLKMELAFGVVVASLVQIFEHVGFAPAAEQMRKTLAKAKAAWKASWQPTVALAAATPPVESMTALRKTVRRIVLYGTAEDTALQISALCGFPRRPHPSSLALAQKVLGEWSFLSQRVAHNLQSEWSRLVLDSAPAMAVLGLPVDAEAQRAADNLHHPLVEILGTTGANTNVGTCHPNTPHIVVTFTVTSQRGRCALTITRQVGASSLCVRLPVQPISPDFADLVQQSIHLSRNDSTSDEWWRRQRQLGHQLESCVDALDAQLLGSFGGMLSAWNYQGTEALASAKIQLVALYKRFLVPVSLTTLQLLDDQVAELFLWPAKMRLAGTLDPAKFQMDFIATLNYFVLDALRLRGYNIDYDMLDLTELESALLSFVWALRLPPLDQTHLVLVPDDELGDLPWESFPSVAHAESVSRCLSLWHYESLRAKCSNPITAELVEPVEPEHQDTDGDTDDDTATDLRPSSGAGRASRSELFSSPYYVLNPAKDLKGATEMFGQQFRMRKWFGAAEQAPAEQDLLRAMESSSCYIYIGHGSGHKFLRGSSVRNMANCPAIMLFGCSSAKLKRGKSAAATGPLIDYTIAAAPLFVGFMWDVPNMDCNRFTQEFLRLCLEKHHSVFVALRLARQQCKIYTTQLAPVIYGLP